jgi:hypothetical protein
LWPALIPGRGTEVGVDGELALVFPTEVEGLGVFWCGRSHRGGTSVPATIVENAFAVRGQPSSYDKKAVSLVVGWL